jgi:hypothetical protein
MITTKDIIKELINSNADIRSVTLVKFPVVRILQDRVSQDFSTRNAINEALNIRSLYSLPFWDSILSTQFSSDLYSPLILKEAAFHNKIISKIEVPRENLNIIDDYASSITDNFGINSCITKFNQELSHFVLLDFHIPNNSHTVPCVEQLIKLLNLTGYLLETNKSYHFIGDKLVSTVDLTKILYNALLYSPIIDKNWIAHQLIEGSCTLRITPKEGRSPFLIKKI